MIRGALVTQLIYVAARLGIADLLHEGPKTPEELATAAGADAPALYRVLRALASLGLFAEAVDGRFEMTPLAEPLRRDVEYSLRGSALLYGESWWWRAVGTLLHSVRTGETAFDHVHGVSLFEYLGRDPEGAALFNQHQANMTRQDAGAIVAAHEFAGIGTLVDVGGGHGALLAAVLKAHPAMRGMLFDVPSVVEGARILLADEGVGERSEVVAGDFFKAVPSGGDAYILKDIIHDWDDVRAITILKNCRRALGSNQSGKVLVVEKVIRSGNEPFAGKLTDITMLLVTRGCERTDVAYRELLATAGLRVTRIVPTQSPASLIEAVAAS